MKVRWLFPFVDDPSYCKATDRQCNIAISYIRDIYKLFTIFLYTHIASYLTHVGNL